MIWPKNMLERRADYYHYSFTAMASPCEILLAIDDADLARRLGQLAAGEALRIEHKFSRYRDDNIIHRLNHAGGMPVEVDDETASLFDYADECYGLSDGRFDITSGILRRVWHFDGSARLPEADAVCALLQHIGWRKVNWSRPVLKLPPDMEIDLGGIGKEYAADRIAALLYEQCAAGMVINLGGDIVVTGPRRNGTPWTVGIETPDTSSAWQGGDIRISRGAIASSGDTKRYLYKDGRTYGHILDPRTGWPPPDAPRMATVLADTCLEAGIMATLAILHGSEADAFLQSQGLTYWCTE